MRKRTRRKVIVPLPPPGLRPKLDAARLRDLDLVHHVNLDAIARGGATPQMLWDLAGSVLAWHYCARKIGVGLPEMEEQLAMSTRMVDRFRRTRRVGFSGEDYQVAKRGIEVMDALARTVDEALALEATDWMVVELNRIAAPLLEDEPCSH
jgi:hypothetical protein